MPIPSSKKVSAAGPRMPKVPMGGGKKDPSQVGGPTMRVYGGDIPPNPADALRDGPLPTRMPEYGNNGVMRRPFNIPTKAALHRRDGLDGAAETVTVNERHFGDLGLSSQPTEPAGDWDHQDYGANPGQDANKYSKGPNDERTKNGVIIYGS